MVIALIFGWELHIVTGVKTTQICVEIHGTLEFQAFKFQPLKTRETLFRGKFMKLAVG